MRVCLVAALAVVFELASAQQLTLPAKAVADVQLPSGGGSTVKFTPVRSLQSTLISSGDAVALEDGVKLLIVDIAELLELRNPGPAFVFINDEARPGFSAIDATLPASIWPYPHSGAVLIGGVFAGRLVSQATGPPSGLAVAVSLAHELAHIYQFRVGAWTRLLAAERNRSRRRAELHADYIAGWISGRLGYRTLGDIDVKSRQLFVLGDQEILDPNHHGTPPQRYAAMLRGFFQGISEPKLTISAISSQGEEFVNSLVPLPSEQ